MVCGIVDFTKGKWSWGPGGSDTKESSCNVGDPSSIPGLGRSSGEGTDNSLQYYCLEKPMDRGACRLQSVGLQRVRHDWATNTFTFKPDLVRCPLKRLKEMEFFLEKGTWSAGGFVYVFNFYWSIVDLQCCVSFRYTQSVSVIHIHISTLFKIIFPYESLQSIK